MSARLLLIAALCLTPELASATRITTWTTNDPITGETCYVRKYISWNTFLWRGVERDLNPVVTQIWRCPSGYVSLARDFHQVTTAQRAAIAHYLISRPKLYATEEEREERRARKAEENWRAKGSPPPDPLGLDPIDLAAESEKWDDWPDDTPDNAAALENQRLEALYRLRDKDDAFWAWFYRVLVRRSPNPVDADAYRAKALPLILQQLKLGTASGYDLIGLRFVAGDYALSLGDHELARKMFDAAKGTVWYESGERQIGHENFNSLIEARQPLLAREHP